MAPHLLWMLIAFVLPLFAVVIIGTIVFYYKNKIGIIYCTSKEKLDGKTVIITGSSAGIGKAAAEDFARRGARLIMACRDADKAQKVADDIISETGNKDVLVKILDTSSLQSVRTFAKGILQSEKRLDVLVLNAGIVGPAEKTLTEDGLEVTLATNHYGHFLLANLLIDLLKKSAPSRIVVTSSVAHTFVASLVVKELDFELNKYSSINTFQVSKLLNVYFTKHLASLTADLGITVNCFCPGLVSTGFFKRCAGTFQETGFSLLNMVIGRTVEQGVQTLIYLAVDEECAEKTGEYYFNCKEAVSTPLGEDTGMAKKIWEKSEEMVKLTQEEIGNFSETLGQKAVESLNKMTSQIEEIAEKVKDGVEKEVEKVQDLLEKFTEISDDKVKVAAEEKVKEGFEDKTESVPDDIVQVSFEKIVSPEKNTEVIFTEVVRSSAQKVEEICPEEVKQCKE